MIAIPAVDLRGGLCVQLVGGRPEEERVTLPDPVGVARGWHAAGFAWLHVVDLDAALDRGENHALVLRMCTESGARVQVGGGLRDMDVVGRVLEAGAERAIVGTRAVEERPWLERLAMSHPGRIVVAADVRDGRVVSRGWTEDSPWELTEFLESLIGLPLAGVLCTDVGREGRMEGIDRAGVSEVVAASPVPVLFSGGVSSLGDLTALEDGGASGAVLGMALYAGRLNAEEIAGRFGGDTIEEEIAGRFDGDTIEEEIAGRPGGDTIEESP